MPNHKVVDHPDMRLIATTPDILDALKEILPMAERGAEQCGHDGFCGPEQSCDCACMAAYYDSVSLAKARKAIQRADIVAQFRGHKNKETYKFAAASEMLKALKLAEEYIQIAEERGYPAENTLSVIRAAIAKAEGRE